MQFFNIFFTKPSFKGLLLGGGGGGSGEGGICFTIVGIAARFNINHLNIAVRLQKEIPCCIFL